MLLSFVDYRTLSTGGLTCICCQLVEITDIKEGMVSFEVKRNQYDIIEGFPSDLEVIRLFNLFLSNVIGHLIHIID